jgi:hypothetical protein
MATPVNKECEICTVNSTEFITSDCSHPCCKECYGKNDKCHVCRALFEKIRSMAITIRFINEGGGEDDVPFFFDLVSCIAD